MNYLNYKNIPIPRTFFPMKLKSLPHQESVST